jgi:V8-like Glu-specific endopeptidase
MSVRRVRVVLAVTLLAVWTGTIGSASAVDAPQRVMPDLSDLEGLGGVGHAKPMALSAADLLLAEEKWDRHKEQSRTPQVVVGEDTRIQVTDTTQFPYSAITQLVGFDENLPVDTAVTCTGSFVGPDVVLTAAHCLWDEDEFGGWIDELVVIPGANDEQTPFGMVSPAFLWIPDPYPTNSEPGSMYDYALVSLADRSVEEVVGSFTLGILTTSELQAQDFSPTTSGYPGDKDFATQWVSSDAAFTAVDDNFLEHSIDSIQGQSGSAVWRESDYTVVGVESFETETENYAVRLDLPIIYDLLTACQELGCQLNHYLTDVPGDGDAYNRVWSRTDQPVLAGAEARTWMWGPAPVTKVMLEPYAEAPNGFRTVLYHEKSRMEITDPNADPLSAFYVTNGLATVELMTGMLQLGHNTFEEHNPAEINVAGDSNDPNSPTYVTFAGLRDRPAHTSASSPGLAGAPVGPVITATVDRAGTVGDDPSLAVHGVTAEQLVPETGHAVASVFWEFMNSSGTVWQDGQFVDALLFENPYFATGFPVTEAYWARILVGGTERVVLVQAFERRVLTYTPGNPEGFLVEAGNIGMHYNQWRYDLIPLEDDDGGGEPIDPPPAVGDLLAAADFATWPEVETTFGDTGMPVGDVYQISNPPTGFLQLIPDGDFDDAYYTLDVRMTTTAGPAAGCLVYRADPLEENPLFNEFAYWICIIYDGPNAIGLGVLYETAEGATVLGGADFLEPLPADEWRQIGVIAQGQKFWVIADETLLGTVEHDIGPGAGQVGILTLNLSDVEGDDVVFELRNLEIYALAGEDGEPPGGAPPGDSPPDDPPQSDCHPSYPDYCIPPAPPQLSCSDLPVDGTPLTVLHNVPDPDPHRFDEDMDGVGCESG